MEASSGLWWRRLAANRLLDVGMAVVALLCGVRLAVQLPAVAARNDFAHYYLTSRLLLDGRNPYTTPLGPLCEKYGFVPNPEIPTGTNPPPLLWLFSPLAMLRPRLAYWVWVGVQLGCLGGILALARQLSHGRLTNRGWYFLCLGSLASAPVYWHLYFSQMQLLLAALVLAGYALHRAGRTTAACLLVSVASVVKLYPAMLLPWFVWRGGGLLRARVGRATLTAGFIGACVVVTGPALWKDWAQYAIPVLADVGINRTFNFNLPTFVANLGQALHGVTLAPTWWTAGLGAGLVVLGLAYGVCVLKAGAMDMEFALLSVAMLIATARTQGHYLVFLIYPVAVAVLCVAAKPSIRRIVYLGGCLALLNQIGTLDAPHLNRHLSLKILLNYFPLYGLFGLGLFFMREMRTTKSDVQ